MPFSRHCISVCAGLKCLTRKKCKKNKWFLCVKRRELFHRNKWNKKITVATKYVRMVGNEWLKPVWDMAWSNGERDKMKWSRWFRQFGGPYQAVTTDKTSFVYISVSLSVVALAILPFSFANAFGTHRHTRKSCTVMHKWWWRWWYDQRSNYLPIEYDAHV